jgi:hypothetical protein
MKQHALLERREWVGTFDLFDFYHERVVQTGKSKFMRLVAIRKEMLTAIILDKMGVIHDNHRSILRRKIIEIKAADTDD